MIPCHLRNLSNLNEEVRLVRSVHLALPYTEDVLSDVAKPPIRRSRSGLLSRLATLTLATPY